jgi:hypothetical protein
MKNPMADSFFTAIGKHFAIKHGEAHETIAIDVVPPVGE